MILLGEGGEPEFNTNLNFLLEEYGMNINSGNWTSLQDKAEKRHHDCWNIIFKDEIFLIDSTIRPHYYKHFHPKECIIGGGIVCNPMCKTVLEHNVPSINYDFIDEKSKVQFIYPYGVTLNVRSPSNVLMTTGSVVYPFNRPIAGYYCNDRDGKILAIGSGYMFEDKYIGEETNMLIWEYLISLLIDQSQKFTTYDFADIDLNDNGLIPDTVFMADQPKICLPESIDCDIPIDFKDMFDTRLHSINNDLLPDVISCYEQVNVKYEPLKLIKPQFEIPLPSSQLAVNLFYFCGPIFGFRF